MYEADGEEFADPYAQIIHGRDRWGKRRNPDSVRAGISLEEFDWKQDVLPRRDFSEVIMYQLKIREHILVSLKKSPTLKNLV